MNIEIKRILAALICLAVVGIIGCSLKDNSSSSTASTSPSPPAGSSPNAPDSVFTVFKLNYGRKTGFADENTASKSGFTKAQFEDVFTQMQKRTYPHSGNDIFEMEESYAVHKTNPSSGEVYIAYVYLNNGKPFVSDGKLGRVSELEKEHFKALIGLFDEDNTIRYIRADSQSGQSFEYILSHSQNKEAMAVSSLQHLPVMRFDSAEKLRGFTRLGDSLFSLKSGYFGEVSLYDTFLNYTESYFEDRVLFVIFAQENSGSNRHSVEGIDIKDGSINFAVRRDQAQIGTTDMADWFILIEMDKAALTGIDKADAHIIPAQQ